MFRTNHDNFYRSYLAEISTSRFKFNSGAAEWVYSNNAIVAHGRRATIAQRSRCSNRKRAISIMQHGAVAAGIVRGVAGRIRIIMLRDSEIASGMLRVRAVRVSHQTRQDWFITILIEIKVLAPEITPRARNDRRQWRIAGNATTLF